MRLEKEQDIERDFDESAEESIDDAPYDYSKEERFYDEDEDYERDTCD